MLARLVSIAVLGAASFVAGCAYHEGYGYRVYDPYYRQYHVWGPDEYGYYNQWIYETHRPYREYRRLRPEEQREYWGWRHDHGEHHGDRH